MVDLIGKWLDDQGVEECERGDKVVRQEKVKKILVMRRSEIRCLEEIASHAQRRVRNGAARRMSPTSPF